MSKANIRNEALKWFEATYPDNNSPVVTSKFYSSQESWSNTRVWFFQLPIKILTPSNKEVHLLCENHLDGDAFFHLKVPTIFIVRNESAFEIDSKTKVLRIYLSAEATDTFKEVRKSHIDFGVFVQNPK